VPGRLAFLRRAPTPAPSAPPRTHRLSKSRYVAGLQCPKLLWWKVHEPDAPELAPEDNQEAILDRGERVADGPGDPREAIARALVAACAGASTVVAYSSFEGRCIDALIEAVPALAPKLTKIRGRIVDLLPIVRDRVYHPDFGGSFSIKNVLPALVTGFGYDDLEIQEGGTAAAALEAMLLDGQALTDTDRKKLRRDLLRYCERDTLAMVRLRERLVEIAQGV
jgi:Domain of unknown function(DUF2779)